MLLKNLTRFIPWEIYIYFADLDDANNSLQNGTDKALQMTLGFVDKFEDRFFFLFSPVKSYVATHH